MLYTESKTATIFKIGSDRIHLFLPKYSNTALVVKNTEKNNKIGSFF